MVTAAPSSLLSHLEKLRQSYGPAHLETDPVRYVHRYDDPLDQEVVAWIAASLAFGRVASIFQSVERVLALLGRRPATGIARPKERLARALKGVVHRWIRGEDLARALSIISEFQRHHGSLGEAFLTHDKKAPDLGPALLSWAEAGRSQHSQQDQALRYLFPSPKTGACKRMNLFLRWMVRPADGVDLGLWTHMDPARLIIPLDTHIAFMSRVLGLTQRKTPSFGMALEITEALRRFSPHDPVRYDWSLSRMGILGHCPERKDPVICPGCPVFSHCALSGPKSRPNPRARRHSSQGRA